MKKKVYYIVAIVVIFFIGMNLYLLLKEDSKAERTVYVNDWTRIAGGDVVQTFETDGVALPDNEQYVYFDARQGNMATFYVEEGDVITEGTPLFSYDTKDLEEQKTAVEIEIERLEDELETVELQISELKKIDTKVASQNNHSSEDIEVSVVVDVGAIVESNIEESIAAAKADEGKIEAELTAAEKKLSQLNDRIDNATVFSDADGQVIQINEDLSAPVMSIASANLAVEGVLLEQQMKDVKVGQKVTMYSELHDHSYSGTISKINKYPKQKPSVGKEPTYSFIVTLEEIAEDNLELDENEEGFEDSMDESEEKEIEEDNLLIGTNLRVNVIVDEAIAVPIISTDSAFSASGKKYVYKLAANGMIEKKEITVGLTFEGDSEVESGLIFNDVIAADPKTISHNNAYFILPMQAAGLQTEELRKMTKKQYAKYILMGLLEN